MPDVVVIGTGMGSLSAAALLSKEGLNVHLIEQNWIPGGCTSSYPRKHFVFESGATTLVGLDEGMPLRFLLDQTGIELNARILDTPMTVYLGKSMITRHQNIDQWIEEAKKHFEGDQEGFWQEAYRISQFVWNSSMKYLNFPPTTFSDLVGLIRSMSPSDIWPARYAYQSTYQIMRRYGVANDTFLRFVNEQLMITAQNTAPEVNFLFGAAALCYTNYQNSYIDGGLINLVKAIIDYIESKGGSVEYRNPVTAIEPTNSGYQIESKKGTYESRFVISGIPINNTLEIWKGKPITKPIMDSKEVNSALQIGIAYKNTKKIDCLHHQIHIGDLLKELGSESIFLSLSHPEDATRAPEPGITIASVSTHFPDPNNRINTEPLVERIVDLLIQKNFFSREDILYVHSSGPKSWQKWTGRKWGFVGGYPQFMKIKPWQLMDVRLDGKRAYQVGDTVYPGQGIPGVTLGGIIAAHKLLQDAGIRHSWR